MYKNFILNELNESVLVLKKFSDKERNFLLIEQAAFMICKSFKLGGKVISCGNGGSNCDSMHFAEELTGKYRNYRSAYPAISISDSSHISCVGNDFGYRYVFSRYVEAIGKKEDILVVFSTSGNSENILEAVQAAKLKNIQVISFTGMNGGKLGKISDIEIRIPHHGYSDRIQEMHGKIIHILIGLIEKNIENKSK
ncbi:phosphoheptose isomerase [Candidatus Riesia sp. GBBU]|nr:phosphoheptose isomerase [Candidatus Riesia sp. GBBU]